MPLLFGNTASAGLDAGAMDALFTLYGNGSTTTFTFPSIPQTYANLHLRYFVRTSNSSYDIAYTYNYNGGLASSNSSYHYLSYDGSTASGSSGIGSFSSVNSFVPGANQTAGVFGAGYLDILDYTSTKQKTVRSFGGYDASGSGYVGIFGNTPLANPTSPVTALSVAFNSAPVAGSYLALYGVK